MYGKYQYSATYNNLHLPQGNNLRYKFDRRLSGPNRQLGHSDNEKIFLPLLGIKHQLLLKHNIQIYLILQLTEHIFSYISRSSP
jgi:hypothetical protein